MTHSARLRLITRSCFGRWGSRIKFALPSCLVAGIPRLFFLCSWVRGATPAVKPWWNMNKTNLADKFSLIKDHWNPRIAGELNGQLIKLVKFQGPFTWHH